MAMRRRKLLAAVRDRMRGQDHARAPEAAAQEPRADATARVAAPARPAEPDFELEQLAAEARYRRDRFDLYRARVISGSGSPTTPGRLRELERAATGAEARLAHARRGRPPRPAP
jgi:hypothetical protein